MKNESEKKGNQYTLKTAQRQAFLEVFNLHAKEGKINKKDLNDMFQRIGYYISQDHFKDICSKAFEFKEQITFEEFMGTFRVNESPYTLRDIKNAFKLIAGEHDQFIPVDLISELFRKNGVEKERI